MAENNKKDSFNFPPVGGKNNRGCRNSAATGRLSSLPLSLSGFNFSVCLRIRNGSHGRSLKTDLLAKGEVKGHLHRQKWR